METSYAKNKTERGAGSSHPKRWTVIVALLLLTVIIITVLYLFRTTPNRIYVSRIMTNTPVYNYSKHYRELLFGGRETNDSNVSITAQPFEEGDIFFTANGCFAFDPKKDSFNLSEVGDSATYIDGKLAGLELTTKGKSLSWLQKVTTDSLQHLQTLILESPIFDAYLPYLEKISAYRKNVSIAIAGDMDSASTEKDVETISRLFSPEILYLGLDAKYLTLLSRFQSARTVILEIDDTREQQLPPLPNLRQCMLEIDRESPINNDFFKNNKQIEKLGIVGHRDINPVSMRLLQNLPELKELTINDAVFFDIDSLHTMLPALRTLIIGDSCTNITALSKFRSLKWLGLPRTIRQNEFDTVLRELPNLQMLEMYGNDSIKSLKAITGLKELKGLLITNKLPDSTTLFQFKRLRYLSVPEKKFTDSSYMQKLVKALPGCIIVPNSGACLGSGWLLLLVPLVAIFIYFRNRPRYVARS